MKNKYSNFDLVANVCTLKSNMNLTIQTESPFRNHPAKNIESNINHYSHLFLFLFYSLQKTTNYYLPSYETISFAIKSLSQKFNWSEAIIFASGKHQFSASFCSVL